MKTASGLQPTSLVVLGIPFHNVDFKETVEWARQRILARKPVYIATANMDFVMQSWHDPEMQRILLEADLVVADGIPIVWLSAFLGPRLKGRVTGSDLVPMLAEMARDHGFSIFNLGGAPGVAEKAADVLVKRFPGLRVAGCYSPPKADLLNMNHEEILARLNASRPDLLFVAFGAPKQEKWVNLHVRNWQVPLSIGIGGSLDFLAGAQKRAPRLFQKLALEWLWRMCSDPPRLFKRYLGNIGFFFRAVPHLWWLRYKADHPFPPLAPDAPLRHETHVEVFPPAGEAGESDTALAALLARTGDLPLVLDMSGVGWLSSAEQGLLLRLTNQLRNRQQPCILTHVGSKLQTLLAWCRLTEYLEIDNSADSILALVRKWSASSQSGQIRQEGEHTLLIQTPKELTAINLDAFKQLIDPILAGSAAREWIVDASLTRFVDSSALGFLMNLKRRAEASQISLHLTGVRPTIAQTFRIAKVDSVLLG